MDAFNKSRHHVIVHLEYAQITIVLHILNYKQSAFSGNSLVPMGICHGNLEFT